MRVRREGQWRRGKTGQGVASMFMSVPSIIAWLNRQCSHQTALTYTANREGLRGLVNSETDPCRPIAVKGLAEVSNTTSVTRFTRNHASWA